MSPNAAFGAPAAVTQTGLLAPGVAFGGRYHVIRLLGAGGMGAVYQAWDNELGVSVALKVIRPEVMVDPEGARDLERRFKRELLLARQVTHKNVVRIHDLGEVDGIKYITMPYIQGTDLSSRLQKEGKLPVPKVLAIARQVAQGLAAAHEAGVVHRDLKPANIMLDEEERAIIMDFGIARSTSGGATMLGAVVGTLEYMAPEQAMGQPVDHRADVYTFGLILYDLLLGRRSAARAESAVAELMQRMQRSLSPARSVDANIPEPLEQIISTCMEPDPGARFQSIVEVIAALENLDNDGRVIDPARREATTRRHTRPAFSFPGPAVPAAGQRPAVGGPAGMRRAGLAAAMVGAILAAGGAAYFALSNDASPARGEQGAEAGRQQLSLAILPFRNQTGDAALDWLGPAVAEMLKGTVEPSRIRTVSSDRVFQIARDLRVSLDREPDVTTVKKLAEFSNATTVLSGRYVTAGTELRIEATLRDVQRGLSEALSATITDQSQVMAAVAALSRGIEEKLLADMPLATSGRASAAPSTESVDALRHYTQGLELGRGGNHLEALKKFEAAVATDAQFALAYAKLAQTYATLGHGAKAEEASRHAVDHASNLPERERFLVEATRAEVLHNQAQAIEAYEKLLQLAPDDPEVRFSLARRYEATGALEKARTHYEHGIQSDPKFFEGLFALARLQVQLKNPEGALDYLNRALTIAIQIDNDEGRGSALHALGNTYKRLNKLADAQRYYTEALDLRQRVGDKRGMASSLDGLGQVQDMLGNPSDALAHYERSLRLQREIGDKRGLAIASNNIGAVYVTLGRLDEALTYFKDALQLNTEIGAAVPQALGLHNIGVTLTVHGQYGDAASYLSRALNLREKLAIPGATAETLRSLGDLDVRLANYDQALKSYLRALELSRASGDRVGAALASLGTGTVFEQQGRYGAALEAKREALDGLRAAKASGALLVEGLTGYGRSLSLLARHDDARASFQEATAASDQLSDPGVLAQLLNHQGDNALIAGRPADAVGFLERAAQKADASKDRYLVLLTRLNLAKAQIASGRGQAAHASAAAAAKEAARLGLRYIASDALLTSGEALLTQKVYAQASRILDAALRDAERVHLRPLLTRAHYALATALQLSGQSAAADKHFAAASRLLGELEAEAGNDGLAKRADFSGIAGSKSRTSPASN